MVHFDILPGQALAECFYKCLFRGKCPARVSPILRFPFAYLISSAVKTFRETARRIFLWSLLSS